jgi:hypothetical protein
VLRVFYCDFWVIDTAVLRGVGHCVEAKLNFIESMCETEEWHVHSLDHANKLFLAVGLAGLIVGGHWNKHLKFLQVIEVF